MSIPKPILSFAVGITGHRSERLGKDRTRIERQLSEVFANIESECLAELNRHPALYEKAIPNLTLLSSLADGADAMAVRLRPPSWKSIGILPYPEEINRSVLKSTTSPANAERAVAEYAQALAASSQTVILPQLHDGDTGGFSRARNILLRQIDMLIAVWDGIAGESAGGTSDVIERALRDGLPVVWISTEKKQAPWMITRIDDAVRETPFADATSGPIAEAVIHQLGIPERHRPNRETWKFEETGATAQTRLHDFLNENVPLKLDWPWVAYDWMKKGLRFWQWRTSKALPSTPEVREAWAPFISALPHDGGLSKGINDILAPRYAAADALATYYGHRYRSAYVMAYAFSVLAVGAALSHFLVGLRPVHLTEEVARLLHISPDGLVSAAQIVLAIAELLFVTSIISIVWTGQTNRWHDRWLDYRALAETLRHLRFLSLIGQYEKRSEAEAAARAGSGWILWYLRATMREIGVPSCDLGPEYQRRILGAIALAELDSQIEYHAANMQGLRRLHSWLHRLGDACFFAAGAILLCVVITLLIKLASGGGMETEGFAAAETVVTVITAFLPALGAAFAGIRFTGDFDGFAQRSAETGAELEQLRDHYEIALDRLDFDMTSDLIYEAARIMAVDITGWTSLYSRKGLTLPG